MTYKIYDLTLPGLFNPGSIRVPPRFKYLIGHSNIYDTTIVMLLMHISNDDGDVFMGHNIYLISYMYCILQYASFNGAISMGHINVHWMFPLFFGVTFMLMHLLLEYGTLCWVKCIADIESPTSAMYANKYSTVFWMYNNLRWFCLPRIS